jgi:hypothetical protein
MLIIWGWRSLLKVLGVGEFHCPRCQADVSYRHVRPRRWFTLFFIPVIPLRWGDPFVECGRCGSAYHEQVLRNPTNRQLAGMLALGARAMYAAVLVAGGPCDDLTLDRAVASLHRYTGDGYTRTDLAADLTSLPGSDPGSVLGSLAEVTSLQGREQLVTGLVRFAHGVDRWSPTVEAVIGDCAAGLGITAAHLAGIMLTAAHADRPDGTV